MKLYETFTTHPFDAPTFYVIANNEEEAREKIIRFIKDEEPFGAHLSETDTIQEVASGVSYSVRY